MNRKGYIYTIESIIAVLILLLYMTFIFTAPPETEWEQITLQKEIRGFMGALEKEGSLSLLLAREDDESLDAILSVVGQSVNYNMEIAGFPERQIRVGWLVREERVELAPHAEMDADPGEKGLPEQDGFAMYRNGTIFNISFVVSDVFDDNITEFSQVNFDFDNDSYYNASFEGPFEISGTFLCQDLYRESPSEQCNRTLWEVGNINRSHLILYPAERTQELEMRVADTTLNGAPISFFFDGISFNTQYESISQATQNDVLFIETYNASEINRTDRIKDGVRVFLNEDKTAVLQTNISKALLEDGFFHETLGFGFVSFGQECADATCTHENVFGSQTNFSRESAHLAEYYFATPLRTTAYFSDVDDGTGTLAQTGWDISEITSESASDTYIVTNITIKDRRYRTVMVNTSSSYDRIFLSPDDTITKDDENGKSGDTVTLGPAGKKETFTIQNVLPPALDHADTSYDFRNLFQKKVRSDEVLLKKKRWRYNVSAHDRREITLVRNTTSPEDAPPGVPTDNLCTPGNYYENASVDPPGDPGPFRVWLTNFSDPSAGCDRGFEFVNFDFNNDGDFNDSATDTHSAEALYQHNDIVDIDNAPYRINLSQEQFSLHRAESEEVSTVHLNTEPYRGEGRVVLFRSIAFSDGEYALLKAIFLRATRSGRDFRAPRPVPEESVGVSFLATNEKDIFIPIEARSEWWRQ